MRRVLLRWARFGRPRRGRAWRGWALLGWALLGGIAVACADGPRTQLDPAPARDSGTRRAAGSDTAGNRAAREGGQGGLDDASTPAADAGTTPARPGRAADATPGTFVVTVKGKLEDGRHFAKLATYVFYASGAVRAYAWVWHNTTGCEYAPVAPIGRAPQPDYTHDVDAEHQVMGLAGVDEAMSGMVTVDGIYTTHADAVHIAWSWGDSESWALTWEDGRLYKLELVGSSYTQGGIYLTPELQRVESPVPVNVGWGFGGPGPDFTHGASLPAMTKDYGNALIMRHNAWAQRDEKVAPTAMRLSLFHPTDTGILRRVFWSDVGHWVFSYVVKPTPWSNAAARRVHFQISHDYNNDGQIEQEIGHVNAGLQIIDRSGEPRGLVFVECSPSAATPDDATLAALYYLDTHTPDAMYGVDPASPDR